MSQKQELGKGLQALLSNINKDHKPKTNTEVAIAEQSIVQLMPLVKLMQMNIKLFLENEDFELLRLLD